NGDDLVLMDEPFNGLDPAQKRDLQSHLLALIKKEGLTTVIVTHDIREVLLMCDRLAFLSLDKRRLSAVFENPFRGQFEELDLFEDPRYRQLYRALLEL